MPKLHQKIAIQSKGPVKTASSIFDGRGCISFTGKIQDFWQTRDKEQGFCEFLPTHLSENAKYSPK